MPQDGLYSWFKSSELTDGNNWVSSVGDFVAKASSGSVSVSAATGHGATGEVVAVSGSTSSQYTFGGDILHDEYTICSLTRYNGDNRNRILTGTRSNWLHGHWAGRAGIAHYESWMGSSSNEVDDVDQWQPIV